MNPQLTTDAATLAGGPAKHGALNRVIEILWAAALILLPITSAPYIIKVTGTLVAPPSLILVGILLVISLLPRIRRRGSIPLEAAPLFFFVIFALISTALSVFIPIPTFKDANSWKEGLEAFVTLGMGISVFLIASTLPADEEDFHKALRWITIGGIAMVAFTVIQAFYLFIQNAHFAPWFIWLEETLITPRPFSRELKRLYGMAFEPSWFTHQLVMLYIPLWLGATFQRISVFKVRVLRLSLENILLGISLGLFMLAQPRVSLLAALLIFAFVFIRLNASAYHWLQVRIQSRFPTRTKRVRTAANFGIILGMVAIYALLVFTLVLILKRDPRMALVFTYPPTWPEIGRLLMLDEQTWMLVSRRFRFLERVVYWISGWRVFNDYPLFGVGLGNSGSFFLDKMPYLGWTSIEVRYLLSGAPFLPNIKSLWVRLLAETGLVGFSIFSAWLVTLWRSTFRTLRSSLPWHRVMAFVCQLMLVALIAEGFSIDSFALPYLWLVAGLAAAAGSSHRKIIGRTLPEENRA